MNNYIKSIVVIFFVAFPISLQAQEIVGGYSLGYGKYLMDDMKSLQKNEIKNMKLRYGEEFKYKSTETFPDDWLHNAYIGVKFSFHEIGLKYDYLTTGGRNHWADYSGEIKNDVTIAGNAMGLYYKFHFLSLPISNQFRFTANAGVSTGAIYNRVKNDYLFDIYDPKPSPSIGNNPVKVDESMKLNSTNWYIQPNIGFQFWFKKNLSLNFDAGYLFDKQGKIHTADTTTGFYEKSGAEYDLGIDWSGLRLSVGIGFAFSAVRK